MRAPTPARALRPETARRSDASRRGIASRAAVAAAGLAVIAAGALAAAPAQAATAHTTVATAAAKAKAAAAAKARFAALAADTPSTAFGIDADGDLVRFAATGGTVTPVASDVSAYTVDATAAAYVITDAGLTKIAADGTSTPILTSATAAASTDVALDASGSVYVLSGVKIYKVPAGSTKAAAVATLPIAPVAFGVATNGTVRVLENVSGAIKVVAYPTKGASVSRTLDTAYTSPVSGQFDSKGDLYFTALSTGASGSVTISRVTKGSATPVSLGGGFAVGGTGLSGEYSLLQSTTWCSAYGLGSGTCTPDLSVAAVQKTSLGGTTTSTAVDGLALTMDDTKVATTSTEVTTDTAGDIFVTQPTGITSYDAAGGAPTTITTAAYSDVQLTK